MSDTLSNKQFATERNLMSQGNMDELRNRVAGYQNMSANIFKPAFSADYNKVQSMPSPARAGRAEDEEDEEAE